MPGKTLHERAVSGPGKADKPLTENSKGGSNVCRYLAHDTSLVRGAEGSKFPHFAHQDQVQTHKWYRHNKSYTKEKHTGECFSKLGVEKSSYDSKSRSKKGKNDEFNYIKIFWYIFLPGKTTPEVVGDADSRGCEWAGPGRGAQSLPVLSAQFCYEPKTVKHMKRCLLSLKIR